MRLQDTDAFILKCFAADIQDLILGDIEDTIKLCTIADRYIERLGNAGHSHDVALSLLNDVVNDKQRSTKGA